MIKLTKEEIQNKIPKAKISVHTLQIHNIRVAVNSGYITAEQGYPLAMEAIIRNILSRWGSY